MLLKQHRESPIRRKALIDILQLYLCLVDKTVHSMNAKDSEWNGNWPEHKSVELQHVNDVPKIFLDVAALEPEKEEKSA